MARFVNGRARQLGESLLLNHSAVQWPWFSSRGSSPTACLHRIAMAAEWRNADLIDRLFLWLSGLSWPLRSLLLCASAVWRKGAAVASSRNRLLQMLDLIRLANRYNMPVNCYYRYRFFAKTPSRPELYLFPHHVRLFDLLYEDLKIGILDDKGRFEQECRRLGLPVAPVIAVFRDGHRERREEEGSHLPEKDLVIKFCNWSCGRGLEHWRYVGSDTWEDGQNRLAEAGVIAHCRALSFERPVVLQERLRNHDGIAHLAGNGLSTIRLVTYAPPSGPTRILFACVRMPSGTNLKDNFAAGGLAAPVDLATGELGVAVKKEPPGEFREHPKTGGPIAGSVLPRWEEACALALRAQECFSSVPFVGWDVVIGQEGPILLEANPKWCLELAQIPHDRPLGDTSFVELLTQEFRTLGW